MLNMMFKIGMMNMKINIKFYKIKLELFLVMNYRIQIMEI